MKFIKITSIVFCVLLFIALIWFYESRDQNPIVNVSAELSGITQEEYDNVNISSFPRGESKPALNAFKKLTVNVCMDNSKQMMDREIIIPSLLLIDSVSAGCYERNNIGSENRAESMEYIIFDGRKLTDQDIKDIYKESEVFVSWTRKNGITEERKYLILEILDVKSP